ncbi:NgoFVII family restriction endonuclease [Clostridium sp. WB02_MRS01]|uniref:restriction endonuclease PLD domain-containing protein n=1 Tax=Clostridium sp. WB02_MRS01 TaxID=2605777 RepID=UPI0012B369FD|nr:restriction endonuclease PLD domain-containing protein [Clostridium sp. WB02_MRS01]MSS11290.1 NgoFVII family restriction endonuclease [Clostridium sp. WB02_MRS01]
MAVLVENLMDCVLCNTKNSDEVIIISGFTTPDVIKDIANLGKKITFYYGMYCMDGITPLTHSKLIDLDSKFGNLTINIVNDYHVHTKCYLFFKSGKLQNALVGSANCSKNGLSSDKNCEMLVELNESELKTDGYLIRLIEYSKEIAAASVHCDDSVIVPRSITSAKKMPKTLNGKLPTSGNPFVAYMPLYTLKNGKKIVNKASGINWGLQGGHSKKGTGYAEAYIPVLSEHIDDKPTMFPFFPIARTTKIGKVTRRYDTVTVLWDDGVVMEMVFSGNGIERPTKKNRKPGEPFHRYPKQLTSGADGGGAVLGEYLRKRMNIPARKLVTLADLKKYKRDFIELRYIAPGYYEANFLGHPLP